MPNAYISGTGLFMPERVVTNDDLAKDYGIDTTHEWILQRTGIEQRRFAGEGVGSSDLAVPAAKQAIERAGLAPGDIDMIVYCTLSPEHCFPGGGVYFQAKMGMEGVPALDVRNQCSGFLYGLATATSMIRAGAYKNILVIGTEVHSAGLDLSTRGRTVACLFGDGAGAAVVSATDDDRGIKWWNLGADGRHADALTCKLWDVRKRPYIPFDDEGVGHIPLDRMWPYMDGKTVFKNAVEKMITSVVGMCWENKLEVADIDLFFFHQANLRINQFVMEQLKIPEEKAPSNIQRYGNTTAATIPTLLAEAEASGRLQPGMKVAMVAFGSGFTWGSTYAIW
ncbi:MAG: 3-oxoacyl-ACP synthase III family protein [Myxococcota bacterium]